MKKLFLIVVAWGLIVSASNFAFAQSAATQTPEQLLQSQEAEVTRLTTSVDELRPLQAAGLIAQLELETAEKNLADAKARVEQTRAQIAAAEKLAAEQKKAAELPKIKPLVKRTSMIVRSTGGNWSIANLETIQQFFSNTFGRPLPTSTIGQSATHNRMKWDHRNAVDVGLHPDSAEGQALITYLQSSGIPFLAFRAAIPGVSTGPHIHIGNPSQRMS